MKRFTALAIILFISGIHTCCYALTCNCDDWIQKEGYCVDYIKSRIPSFPIPLKDDMPNLKNTYVADIDEGDVAIFVIKNYWHVAYVEKVHRNSQGEATAIDVSEMNYGDDLSFAEFKAKWKSKSRNEWYRASCCGITDSYDQVTSRQNVDIDTVKQVWSPDVASEGKFRRQWRAVVGKVREVINKFSEIEERL